MQALPPRLVAPGGACKSMASAADTGDKRVLIVDDSKFVRTTFNRILSASFSVVEAVDGDAAWKAIQSDPAIAMVFSDLDIPKLDGYGLLRLEQLWFDHATGRDVGPLELAGSHEGDDQAHEAGRTARREGHGFTCGRGPKTTDSGCSWSCRASSRS